MRRGGETDEGIMGPDPRRDRFAANIGLEPVTQEFRVALVDFLEAGNREACVGEGFGGDGGWGLHGSTAGLLFAIAV